MTLSTWTSGVESIKIFTQKTLCNFIDEGGVGWWRVSQRRAEKCEFVICTRNTPDDKSQHGTAFFIGKVSGVARDIAPGKDGKYRYLIHITEYADLDIHGSWGGARNPFVYLGRDQLGIDPDRLVWNPFPQEISAETINESGLSEFNQTKKDIEAIWSEELPDQTDRDALVKARLGQGEFRMKLIKTWGGRCPITGCDIPDALRASHILAWSDASSTNKTRLDPNNGLLLAASVDALFDRHLISFSDEGELLFSGGIEKQKAELGIQQTLIRYASVEQKGYMAMHKKIFDMKQARHIFSE